MNTQTISRLTKMADEYDLVRNAVVHLEEEHDKLRGNIANLMQRGRQAAYGDGGEYKGVWGDEYLARQFGLWMLGLSKDQRLADYARSKLDRSFDVYEKAMDSATDGSMIAPEFSPRLKRLIEMFGTFRRNTFIMPMNSDVLSFPKLVGEAEVFLLAENVNAGETDVQAATVTLNAREWGAFVAVPLTLAEDAAVEIGEILARSFASSFAGKEDDCAFNGDGTADYFGVVGIRSRLLTLYDVTGGAGLVLGSGNEWSELTLIDHENVAAALPFYGGMEPAWFCSHTYYWKVMVRLMLDSGGVTASEIEGRRRPMFLGYPVEFTQKMPKTQANSQIPALFGDLRFAATLGDRRQFTVAQSDDYAFRARQRSYLATQRVAINIDAAGTEDEAGAVVGILTAAS